MREANILYLVVSKFCDVDLHPDWVPNSQMGLIFENLIRRFNELANETAGDHFTPREVIRLMVHILFIHDDQLLATPGTVRKLLDPACGTGGMLAEAQNYRRCGCWWASRSEAAVMRVEVKPEPLTWARERAGLDIGLLARRFPHLEDWERGAARPTLKQLESFAKATYTPVGYLFLPVPPVERVPIPDLRTVGNKHVGHPSPDLLDTVYICQQRQEWYRDFARSAGEAPLASRRPLRALAPGRPPWPYRTCA
jgi:transcriptional regulator with XRE-family HTH domain